MTTEAKRRANERNAQRSTGPTTIEGRARSSMNAVKHGLLAKRVLLMDESEEQFLRFSRSIMRALTPMGGMERALANRIVAASWRLRRFERIETFMLEQGRKNWRGDEVGLANAFVGLSVNGDVFSKLSRYEAALDRSLFRALRELQRLQEARRALPSSTDAAREAEAAASGPGAWVRFVE